MQGTKVTLKETRETINHLLNGVDPYSGEVIDGLKYPANSRMTACLTLTSELLSKCIAKAERSGSGHRKKFGMTESTASRIVFPPGDVGVKGIVTAVNQEVDSDQMTCLTIMTLYKVLKEIGVLDKSTGSGKVRTVTSSRSAECGIKTVKNTFQGEEYDRIMYTDQAKAYIRKNLPVWFPLD